MSNLFLHGHLPRAKRYAKRAEECRRLAKISPEPLRESYLELAAEYEELAKEAEKSATQVSHKKD
jgi:hypothetical protein